MKASGLTALGRRLNALEEAAGVHGPEPITAIELEIIAPDLSVVERRTIPIPNPNRSNDHAELQS